MIWPRADTKQETLAELLYLIDISRGTRTNCSIVSIVSLLLRTATISLMRQRRHTNVSA